MDSSDPAVVDKLDIDMSTLWFSLAPLALSEDNFLAARFDIPTRFDKKPDAIAFGRRMCCSLLSDRDIDTCSTAPLEVVEEPNVGDAAALVDRC